MPASAATGWSVSCRVGLFALPLEFCAFPRRTQTGSYTLSFRLDAFNDTSSSVAVTNVLTGFAGADQPIKLDALRLGSNNTPVLQLTGASNFTYLVDWTPSALLLNTNGTVLFADPAVTNSSQRFYRAVMQEVADRRRLDRRGAPR